MDRRFTQTHIDWEKEQDNLVAMVVEGVSKQEIAWRYKTNPRNINFAFQKYEITARARLGERYLSKDQRAALEGRKAAARLAELIADFKAKNEAHKQAAPPTRSATFEDELQAVANGRGIRPALRLPDVAYPFSLTGDGGFNQTV